MPQPIRLTLLAVLCWSRTAEITDSLVDLLIEGVHKIRAHAENRVEKELVRDLKRVRGKQGLLFPRAQAAVEHPTTPSAARCFPSCQRRRCASSSRRPWRASGSTTRRCAR
ncbi:MAG: hypothetical protein QOD83_1258 [Solirubrobacteraceae bacterium]|nr:hypothetical protein [Solirubrobacteraceae bacterium]